MLKRMPSLYEVSQSSFVDPYAHCLNRCRIYFRRNMIAFDVFLNRKKLARAGMGSDGVLTAITTRVRLSSRSFCALAMRSS